MQINNNNWSNLVFQKFHKIHAEKGSSEPYDSVPTYDDQTLFATNSFTGVGVVGCRDGDFTIFVFDRDTTLPDELVERLGLKNKIMLRCYITNYQIIIDCAEFADKLYNIHFLRIMQGAAERDGDDTSDIAEQIKEAKEALLKFLLAERLDEILFETMDKVGENTVNALTEKSPLVSLLDETTSTAMKELVDEFFANNGFEKACREILDDFIEAVQKSNYQVPPNIPILTEEEMENVEPNYLQRKKDDMFFAGFVN
jgi:bifunctional DNA-binding transcriptional regulator/antitoxin component of YhaV-PrlF toxin-antitoxin module